MLFVEACPRTTRRTRSGVKKSSPWLSESTISRAPARDFLSPRQSRVPPAALPDQRLDPSLVLGVVFIGVAGDPPKDRFAAVFARLIRLVMRVGFEQVGVGQPSQRGQHLL